MKDLKSGITFSILLYLLYELFCPCILQRLPNCLTPIVSHFICSSFLVSISFSLLFILLWKIPIVNHILKYSFSVNSKIYGTWAGKMFCEYDNSERIVYLVIHQPNAFKIDCNYFTENRDSISKNALLIIENHKETLVYQYFAKEDLKNQKFNPVHSGTCILNIENNGKELNGQYYTNNGTKGRIKLTKIVNKRADSYKQADFLCSRAKKNR